MELEPEDVSDVLVIWRDKQFNVQVNPNSAILEFGHRLQELTNVRTDTLRLLVPQSKNRSARVVAPFSDEDGNISLFEASVLEGKPIRMMGALDDEVKEVSQSSIKSDSRILGFDEEEKRLKQQMWNGQQAPLKLPQGTYIFCDFRTLDLPGIKLNPPPPEALKRMHMLACDPGVIAIMNKHRWRVGIMTEMAPEGYVGISPKCILGFNKNHGEEISLRLRTDDLKGFRKYESIKKTLLHELAHMVYSEHDANFYALDKQLNEEALSLDWTKSRSHTLSGRTVSNYYDEELTLGGSNSSTGQKLGGAPKLFADARVSSAAAAYNRILNSSSEEPDPSNNSHSSDAAEPDPDDSGSNGVGQRVTAEPDPDDAGEGVDQKITGEPVNYDTLMMDDCTKPLKEYSAEITANDAEVRTVDPSSQSVAEPDPDESTRTVKGAEPDPDDSYRIVSGSNFLKGDEMVKGEAEPDPDDHIGGLDSEALQILGEPVAAFSSRIQKAIKMLSSEAPLADANAALQTLFKIIRNVIDHPEEVKFRRLRKSNPQIQRNVVKFKAAMEVLTTVGFSEDDVYDEVGRKETYLVLKRNDPGLLWLAKSFLEVSMA